MGVDWPGGEGVPEGREDLKVSRKFVRLVELRLRRMARQMRK